MAQYASSSAEEEEDLASESECESGSYESESEGSSTSNDRVKRPSYSKEALKPTREGSLIQSGVDLKQVSVKELATPDYVNKQLKATDIGEKVKQGEAFPRDHAPLADDPNAHLGDLYKSHSTKFKPTGYGDKLKQGADVPRDHIPAAFDPNANLGETYKSHQFKSTGLGEKIKQGQDIRRESSGGAAAAAFASVNLKKAGNPEEKLKNKSKPTSKFPAVNLKKTGNPDEIIKNKPKPKSKFPEVKLQKTAPVSKDDPKKFELPGEFSAVKQNLKRRTERPWYSQGVETPEEPKKWFFQRGEWNDGTPRNSNDGDGSASNTASRSWFGRNNVATAKNNTPQKVTPPPPSSYRGITTKRNVAVQHYNIPSNSGKPKFNIKRRHSKNSQRRRRQRFLCILVVLPLLLVVAFYGAVTVYPDEMDAGWKKVLEKPQVQKVVTLVEPHVQQVVARVQPQVKQIVARVQPYIQQLQTQVQPHIDNALVRVRPTVEASVDHFCSAVQGFVVPHALEKQTWLVDPLHKGATSLCESARAQLSIPNPVETNEDSVDSRAHHHKSAGGETIRRHWGNKNDRPAAAERILSPYEAVVDDVSSSNHQEQQQQQPPCTCDDGKTKRKGWRRLVPGRNKKAAPDCCSTKGSNTHREL